MRRPRVVVETRQQSPPEVGRNLGDLQTGSTFRMLGGGSPLHATSTNALSFANGKF